MQALGVVRDDQLPVGLDVVGHAVRASQLVHAPRPELVGERADLILEGRRAGREVRKDMTVPHVHLHRAQRDVVLAEAWRAVHVRRGDEPAVQAVRPRVIRTLDALGEMALGLRAQPGAPMPAHVVEAAEPAAGVPRDDHAFAGDVAQHVVARGRQVLDARDTDPHVAEKPRLLAREVRAVGVVLGRQRLTNVAHAVNARSMRSRVIAMSASVCASDTW